ncbi:MAG: ATP-binding cassette domain-containing protein, partial [Thaumarchaeota archaeon]|nr:ATP-binding cassette domain-containing protein [Nitrososphaerota archaeon]
MPLLEVKDLRVHYRVYEGTLKVLNGINISLEKWEKVGIIGESACGKTTTVKSVMRLLASNAKIAGGEVSYAGEDVLAMPKGRLRDLRRKKMSMIFQDPSA